MNKRTKSESNLLEDFDYKEVSYFSENIPLMTFEEIYSVEHRWNLLEMKLDPYDFIHITKPRYAVVYAWDVHELLLRKEQD